MRPLVQVATILLISLTINAIASEAAECNFRKAADETYARILKNSLNQNSSGEYFTAQSKLIALLASIRTRQANQYLVKLENYYLGEAVGEILAEAITAKKNQILSILESELAKKSECDSNLYKCSERDAVIRRHIEMIKSGQIFQSDEKPLKLYKKNEVCRELSGVPTKLSDKIEQ